MPAAPIRGYRVTFADGCAPDYGNKLVRVRCATIVEGYSQAILYAAQEWPHRDPVAVRYLATLTPGEEN